MDTKNTIEKLDEKVSEILQRFHSLKAENEMIRNELTTLKAEKEITTQEMERLSEENTMKDLEIEEIVSKIESILG